MPGNSEENTENRNLLGRRSSSKSSSTASARNRTNVSAATRTQSNNATVVNENKNLKAQIAELQLQVERLQRLDQTATKREAKTRQQETESDTNASLREVALRGGRGSNHKRWLNIFQRTPSSEERDDNSDSNESGKNIPAGSHKNLSQPTMNLVPHQVQQHLQPSQSLVGIHRRHHSPGHRPTMKDVTEEELASVAIELPDLLKDTNDGKRAKAKSTTPSPSPKKLQKMKKYLLKSKLSNIEDIADSPIKEKLSDDGELSFGDTSSAYGDIGYEYDMDDLNNHEDEEALMVNNREDFMRLLWDRSSWLVGLMILQSCSSFILKNNEAMLQKHAVIVQFLTMLVGAGGNAGNQASVRVIRGLAVGTLNSRTVKPFLHCELKMAICLSVILGFTGFIRALLFSTPMAETVAITTSLIFIVLISIILGVLLPLGMKKCHVDPAHSSTSIQVLMDILGVTLTVYISGYVLSSAFHNFGITVND